MDVNPVSSGHALVVPKEHFESVSDVNEDILKEIIIIAKQVGEASKIGLGATGFNILNATGKDAQQSVNHLHFHVIPRYPNDNLNLWFHGENKTKQGLEDVFEKYCKELKI